MLPLHHSHHEARTTGLEPAPPRLTTECSAAELRPRRVGRRVLLPATGRRDVASTRQPGASCCPSTLPASACPRRHLLTGRPWRLIEASCTLGPMLCIALVPSLPGPPVGRPFFQSGAGGIRTHGLELMRLARTTAPLPRCVAGKASGSPPRQVWPAGFEPAVSGSRNRRSGRALPQPDARGGTPQSPPRQYPRRDSNPQLPG